MTIQQMFLGISSKSLNEIKFYEIFQSGTGTQSIYEPAYVEWLNAFESASNVIELRAFFGNENEPTYTITDASYIQGLQAALSSGNNFGSGTTSSWFLGWGCGSPGTISSFVRGSSQNPSFHFGNNNACQCESTPVIRPLIGNQNWGGFGGGCNQSTQSMGLSFIIA